MNFLISKIINIISRSSSLKKEVNIVKFENLKCGSDSYKVVDMEKGYYDETVIDLKYNEINVSHLVYLKSHN